jgi:hypothetical protein
MKYLGLILLFICCFGVISAQTHSEMLTPEQYLSKIKVKQVKANTNHLAEVKLLDSAILNNPKNGFQGIKVEQRNNFCPGKGKHLYSYDSHGRMTKEIENEEDLTSGAWIPYGLTEMSYNTDSKRPSTIIYKSWDKNLNNWTSESKSDYTINNFDSIIAETHYNWANDSWQPLNKVIYQYNLLSNSIEYQNWDKIKFTWNPERKILNTVNDKYLIIEEVESNYDTIDGIFAPKYKRVFDYTNDLNTQNIEYIYDSNIQNWKPNAKYENTYSGNILVSSTSSEFKNDLWVPVWKISHLFDQIQRINDRIFLKWDQSTQSFKNDIKYSFEYLANTNFISKTSKIQWNSNAQVWQNQFLNEFVYDGEFYLLKNKNYSWIVSEDRWNFNYMDEYYYSQHEVLGTQNILDLKPFILYPNPSFGEIQIKLEHPNVQSLKTIEIYNTLGVLCYSNTLVASQKIDISNLSKGNYILVLKSENRLYLGFSKFIRL